MSQNNTIKAFEAILARHKGVTKIWQTSDGFLFLNETDANVQEGNLKGPNAKAVLVYGEETPTITKTKATQNGPA